MEGRAPSRPFDKNTMKSPPKRRAFFLAPQEHKGLPIPRWATVPCFQNAAFGAARIPIVPISKKSVPTKPKSAATRLVGTDWRVFS